MRSSKPVTGRRCERKVEAEMKLRAHIIYVDRPNAEGCKEIPGTKCLCRQFGTLKDSPHDSRTRSTLPSSFTRNGPRAFSQSYLTVSPNPALSSLRSCSRLVVGIDPGLWSRAKAIFCRGVGLGPRELAPEVSKALAQLANIHVKFSRDLAQGFPILEFVQNVIKRFVNSVRHYHSRDKLSERDISEGCKFGLQLLSCTHIGGMGGKDAEDYIASKLIGGFLGCSPKLIGVFVDCFLILLGRSLAGTLTFGTLTTATLGRVTTARTLSKYLSGCRYEKDDCECNSERCPPNNSWVHTIPPMRVVVQ